MAVIRPTASIFTGSGGITNYTRGEIAARARQILESDDYQANLISRVRSNTLPAQIEALLYYYAYGKPVENVNLNVSAGPDLSNLSLDELQDMAKNAVKTLEEVRANENAISAVASTTVQ